MCIRENSTKSPGFEANTAVTYNEDQTHESPKPNFTAEPVDETMTMDKAVAPSPKRSAKIHDFCLGIPFGKFEKQQTCKSPLHFNLRHKVLL